MPTLDWYFDFISPFSYLQCARFPALPVGVDVCRKPVLLSALLDQAVKTGSWAPSRGCSWKSDVRKQLVSWEMFVRARCQRRRRWRLSR